MFNLLLVINIKMKQIVILSTIVTLLTIATGCKKKETPPPPPPPIVKPSIYGMWKGKYAPDSASAPTLDVIYRIDESNTVYVYNGTDTSTAVEKGKSEATFIFKIGDETGLQTIYSYYSNPSTKFGLEVIIDSANKTFEGEWDYYIGNTQHRGGDIIATKM
jgi:hypothetical protein